jgi:hypothetical protein
MEPEWSRWLREHPGETLPLNLLRDLLREREHDLSWRDREIERLRGELSVAWSETEALRISAYLREIELESD